MSNLIVLYILMFSIETTVMRTQATMSQELQVFKRQKLEDDELNLLFFGPYRV
jgi:hypothetical protein